ncbi:MAG: biopolymer transporter ExbD [Muribaculaceae bacterium]|nr:biopolymer transporter ExbD [Muribaculaceae bacterium]MDE6193120.1 biopolymer transporter ExbD [Muribaculaceae bacterium]MDE6856779.1 biopolymer transporter ExbD [Muribaculaceae bacterium]
MPLKRSFQSLETFSMSSMTDVIFLLLIFFMVTSTLIFPAAIDVNLPQSSEQTSQKPLTEVYVDSLSQFFIVMDRTDSIPGNSTPRAVTRDELVAALTLIQQQDSTRGIALYADEKVEYGRIVELLDMAARRHMKMVLATRALQETPATQEASPN